MYLKFFGLITGLLGLSFALCNAQYADRDTIIDNKIFRKNASYLTLSMGEGYNFKNRNRESDFRAELYIPVSRFIINGGFVYQAESFLFHNSDDTVTSIQSHKGFHLGSGYRFENSSVNLSLIAGPGCAIGYNFHHIEDSSKYYKAFFEPSLYLAADLVYKPVYDMGIGIGIFAHLTRHYPIAGLQVTLYLSNSYKGKIKY